MQVLIVYESIFGNTHRVAGAIERGIRDAAAEAVVNCLPVSRATPDLVAAADLLVVGGPTHARMTIARSRRDAVTRTRPRRMRRPRGHPLDQDAEGPGLRDWFHAMPKTGNGHRAAAFDTRLAPRLAGGAAKGIARRLREHGYRLAVEPEGFIVEGDEGPMRAGELDRAHDWAAALRRGPPGGATGLHHAASTPHGRTCGPRSPTRTADGQARRYGAAVWSGRTASAATLNGAGSASASGRHAWQPVVQRRRGAQEIDDPGLRLGRAQPGLRWPPLPGDQALMAEQVDPRMILGVALGAGLEHVVGGNVEALPGSATIAVSSAPLASSATARR